MSLLSSAVHHTVTVSIELLVTNSNYSRLTLGVLGNGVLDVLGMLSGVSTWISSVSVRL